MLSLRTLLTAVSVLLLASPVFAVTTGFEPFTDGEADPFDGATPVAHITLSPDGPPHGGHLGP